MSEDTRTPAEIRADERRPTFEAVAALDAEYKRRFLSAQFDDGVNDPAPALADWYSIEMLKLYGLDRNHKDLGKGGPVAPAYLPPEIRQAQAQGLICRRAGHDLTTPLENGRAPIYLARNGSTSCQRCRQDAVLRHKEKVRSDASA